MKIMQLVEGYILLRENPSNMRDETKITQYYFMRKLHRLHIRIKFRKCHIYVIQIVP